MNKAFDLFESRVARVYMDEQGANVIFSHGYVHHSKGTPGIDPGTGWSQEIQITLINGHIEQRPPSLPQNVADGYLHIKDRPYQLVPLPFKLPGEARLHLVFPDNSELVLKGDNARVRALSDPVFLEET